MASNFTAGQSIVVQERWHGRLWSAVPHVWVGGGEQLVSFLPRGVMWAFATNRDMPEAAGLDRDQRKLAAMQTCVYRVAERASDISALHFFAPGHWSRVNLGWTADGTFMGWYVNFERPPALRDDGLETKDLVLDIGIAPDRSWRWKDREDLDTAIERGILPAEVRDTLLAEADAVLRQCAAGSGPFDPRWIDWTPKPEWGIPELPAGYRKDGRAWTAHEPDLAQAWGGPG
jgi:protein associated with RNAse G/E